MPGLRQDFYSIQRHGSLTHTDSRGSETGQRSRYKDEFWSQEQRKYNTKAPAASSYTH